MTQVIASLSVNPREPEALSAYFRMAAILLDEVGAKVVKRMEIGDPAAGGRAADIIMIVEFPDADAIARVLESPEYRAIIPMRDRAFRKYNLCVVSDEDDPSKA